MENFINTRVNDAFWSAKQKDFLKGMLEHQWRALNDEYENCENHTIRNIKMAAGVIPREELPRDDFGKESDLAKWMEAVAAYIYITPDESLEDRMDYVIDLFEKAQLEDGYANAFMIVYGVENRFKYLWELHEMYCAGHLAEAAVMYYRATGKRKFLDVMCRYFDLFIECFGEGEGQIHAADGHQEAELALIKIYEATGEKKYLDFAETLINIRGKENRYEYEESYPEWRRGHKHLGLEYFQAHKPFSEQQNVVGHAVRALYYYCGITDLAKYKGDKALFDHLDALYDDLIGSKMYVTGGVGAHVVGEAFSVPFDLPADRAYSETCASIALALWSMRMLEHKLSEKYAATMERALYNTLLSGVSLDGTKYFYVNPLAVDPVVTEYRSDEEHIKTARVSWFGCACCPPNIARTLATFGKFIFTLGSDFVSVNLYAAGEIEYAEGTLKLDGDLLKDGKFTLTAPAGRKVMLRIPEWADEVTVDGESYTCNGNYLALDGGSSYSIEVKFSPRFLYANSAVSDAAGKAALQYGPFIYCAEEADNGAKLHNLVIDTDSEVKIAGEIGSLPTLSADGVRIDTGKGLYNVIRPEKRPTKITLVPYGTWNNRGKGEMRVWLMAK